MKKVQVIGIGMGPADLTAGAAAALAGAGVLAGGPRLLEMFPEHPGERLALRGGLAPWLAKLELAAQDKSVAVLASGDACYYGVGGLVVKRLGRENVAVHPGIGALPTLFARLGQSWKDVTVASVHGRGMEGLWPHLRTADQIAVFTDPDNGPAQIAAAMLARGLSAWSLVAAEDLGSERERIGEYSLEQAAEEVFSPLNLVLLKRLARPEPLWLGMPEENYQHQAGLITKSEARAAALAALRLAPGQTLWDLGAGSGSVGLEACLLLGRGRVFAVERQADRVAQIKANRARFCCANLEVVNGEMPQVLAQLPDPDRVFVGGGGNKLVVVARDAAHRLPAGGVLVVSAVRLSAIEAARATLESMGMEPQVTQIQASRGRALAEDLYLKAANPVWLVAGVKK